MANQEHLGILKQGVEEWNKWRENNSDIVPDLTKANLSGADLSGAILFVADLSKADLGKADLRGADLREASLIGATLSGATLSGADLDGAHLGGAHLRGATLRGATLFGADLGDAYLSGADLSGADLSDAYLSGAYLRGAILFVADLSEADLSKADLSKADLSEADLSKADLSDADLSEADLREADLREASLDEAHLRGANLRGANLIGADLSEADLREADLGKADLGKADFSKADLSGANLRGANLRGANLRMAILIGADFTKADLSDCSIYGISAWNVTLDGAEQQGLIITHEDEPAIMVDNLEVAQFIYLLLYNKKIREVIDTIGKKAVLILGRFTPERKAILDAIREALRRRDYLPILFDFEGPESRDLTETVSTLAHMARFIIADLTEPSSLPKELEAIVPTLAVPVQPLLKGSTRSYSMFKDYCKYPWVLKVHLYDELEGLLASLEEKVIAPAEAKVRELQEKRKLAARGNFAFRGRKRHSPINCLS